jgi:hypothetical protein
MSQRRAKGKVSGIHKASKTKATPKPRVITAPEVVQLPLGTPAELTAMGISATGVGPLYLAPELGKKLKAGTYDVQVIAKSDDPMWLAAKVSLQIVVLGTPRTLTGGLTGAWKTGDTLALPPAGLTLSAGPENYRVVAPPGGVFLNAGTIPVVIEVAPSGAFSAARWEGTATVAKGQPTITWTVKAPLVKGVAVGDKSLFATIQPNTLAFNYAPSLGTQPDYGDVTLTASRKADDNYEAATASVPVKIVGNPGQFDNPLDLARVPKKSASPDVGGMSTPQLAKAFANKTPRAVMNELNQVGGITATLRPGKSSKVTMLDVEDRRPGRIKYQDNQRLTAIEFHQGGGIHGATPYVRVSTTQGKIKVVQPGYNPRNEKPIETIYITGI